MGEPEPRPQFDPIEDEDVPGCRALLRAVLLRAIHDACGCSVTPKTKCNRLEVAQSAWSWLHATDGPSQVERAYLADEAGYDPEDFDAQVAKAELPWPATDAALADNMLNLERAYWRMAGRNGPEPTTDPLAKRLYERSTTRAGRRAEVRSIVLRSRFDARVTGNGRRASLVPALA